MGYNRSGQRRKERLRRNKREVTRREARVVAEAAKSTPTKVIEKVKGLAKEAVAKLEESEVVAKVKKFAKETAAKVEKSEILSKAKELAKEAVTKVEEASRDVAKKVKGEPS